MTGSERSKRRRGKMQVEEAKILLGFSPASRPDPSQIKAAYLKKVWESHPDLFPDDQKLRAESKFKSISEAYSCLESDFESLKLQLTVRTRDQDILYSVSVIATTILAHLGLQVHGSGHGDLKGQRYTRAGVYSRVVKTGVPRPYASAKRGNRLLIGAPFLLIVLGTIGLGGINANRAYNLQKETFPSHNPFLP